MEQSSSPYTSTRQPLHNRLVIYRYGDRNVILSREENYFLAVEVVRDYFNITGNITLGTILDGITGSCEVPPELWAVVSPSISVVMVFVDTDCGAPTRSTGNASGGPGARAQRSHDMITIEIRSISGMRKNLNIRGSDPISEVFNRYSSLIGVPRDAIKLFFNGRQLKADSSTVQEAGITNGSQVLIVIPLLGGKPVIYLYPPTAMSVSVKLTLIPAWEYSAVYPLTVIKKRELAKGQVGQHIEWNVHAYPSGLLRDKLSGKDIAYLFWEAETCVTSSQPISTPSSRANSPALTSRLADTSLAFNPNSPQVTPDNSILLPAHKIPSYLDDALTVLGLHIEARTSFITYWLPSIMKHPHVALRFLPQESYETAAPMEITPRPDVVTRIFMVARGLDNKEAQLEEWVEASLRASQPVEIWQGIVGMCLERALNPTIFRVLEWGGMFAK